MSNRYVSPGASEPLRRPPAKALLAGRLAGLCIVVSAAAAAADNRQRELVPQVVQQMSAEYVGALVDRSDEERAERRRLYQEAFLAAFTSRLPWHRSENASIDGYAAGRQFLNDKPTRRAEIMSGFGYLHVTLSGTWSTGFEVSSFATSASGTERWWLSLMPDARIDFDRERFRGGASTLVRVDGWLSPKGRHGHMNMYVRELFASSIIPDVVEPSEEAAAADR